MTYMATFFTHYDALTFCNELRQRQMQAKMMPVPRKISSSCGTGVQFEDDENLSVLDAGEVDKIFRMEKQQYRQVYENAGD